MPSHSDTVPCQLFTISIIYSCILFGKYSINKRLTTIIAPHRGTTVSSMLRHLFSFTQTDQRKKEATGKIRMLVVKHVD